MAVALTLVTSGTGGGLSPAQAQACLSRAEAQQAFSERRAAPLAARPGAISAATGGGRPVGGGSLCDAGGRLVWIVVILTGRGEQRTVTVDAVSGAVY